MQLIAYFSNGPLQGKYRKVSVSSYYHPVVRRMSVFDYNKDLPDLLHFEYTRQLPPLFEDADTVIFDYKIESWAI